MTGQQRAPVGRRGAEPDEPTHRMHVPSALSGAVAAQAASANSTRPVSRWCSRSAKRSVMPAM